MINQPFGGTPISGNPPQLRQGQVIQVARSSAAKRREHSKDLGAPVEDDPIFRFGNVVFLRGIHEDNMGIMIWNIFELWMIGL